MDHIVVLIAITGLVLIITARKKIEQMIKVSVFYPNEEGKKFDMDSYIKGHISMVQEFCGEAIRGLSVEQGLVV